MSFPSQQYDTVSTDKNTPAAPARKHWNKYFSNKKLLAHQNLDAPRSLHTTHRGSHRQTQAEVSPRAEGIILGPCLGCWTGTVGSWFSLRSCSCSCGAEEMVPTPGTVLVPPCWAKSSEWNFCGSAHESKPGAGEWGSKALRRGWWLLSAGIRLESWILSRH